MRLIISWSHQNANMYAVFRGWGNRTYKIVTEPEQLRGLPDDTEIYVLGPEELYRFGKYRTYVDYINFLVDRAQIVYDETDNWIGGPDPLSQEEPT